MDFEPSPNTVQSMYVCITESVQSMYICITEQWPMQYYSARRV